jgi:Uma2 family endonuclease
MHLVEEPKPMPRHRLTVDEYYRMAEAGVLAPDARVELIEGEIVDMAPIGTRHGSAVKRLNTLLMNAVGTRGIVAVQDPLRLSLRSEPEPDLMLLKPRTDFYRDAHPTAADVLLLIEVSDTTSRYDREVKIPLYAKHGVTEVWIVDLDYGMVRFYRRPQVEGYADITATETPSVTPVPALPGIGIDLAGVLA